MVDPPSPAPGGSPPDDVVVLTDLEVIQRYSLALRALQADRDELVEVLRSDLAWLTGREDVTASVGPVARGPVARGPAR